MANVVTYKGTVAGVYDPEVAAIWNKYLDRTDALFIELQYNESIGNDCKGLLSLIEDAKSDRDAELIALANKRRTK